jgi:two-component system, OmpR family, sensor kinase
VLAGLALAAGRPHLVPAVLLAAAAAGLGRVILATRRRAQEVAHEARSALAAVEGAVAAMTGADLTDRTVLAQAVTDEVARLRYLLDPARTPVTAGGLLRPPMRPFGTALERLGRQPTPAPRPQVGRRRLLTPAARGRMRRLLSPAVTSGAWRLRRLPGPATTPPVAARMNVPEPEGYGVAGVVGPVVAAERARGTVLEWAGAEGLRAQGRPQALADALRTLLDNARRHAPGPVTVRAGTEAGRVVVRVEDRGPGVPARRRRAVFLRGHRVSAAPGDGLGLWLAATAVREAGGRVWVEARPGGGASFAVALPPVKVP